MANIKFAEMILEIMTQFGGRLPGKALHHQPWTSKVTVSPLFSILRKYEAYYVYMLAGTTIYKPIITTTPASLRPILQTE